MGNSFTSCVGKRKGTSPFPQDQPDSGFISDEKSLNNSFGSRFLEYGTMRRFTRQESTNLGCVRNKPTSGLAIADNYDENSQGTSRGKVIIFAMTDFEEGLKKRFPQLHERKNTLKDASDLSSILDQSGYDVQVLWNPTGDLTRSTLKTIGKNEKLSNSDSFICVVLTMAVSIGDGGEDLLAFFDEVLPRRKLTNPLWKIGSEALAGIPKIFVFEATIASKKTKPETIVESPNFKTEATVGSSDFKTEATVASNDTKLEETDKSSDFRTEVIVGASSFKTESMTSTLTKKLKNKAVEKKFPSEEPDFLIVQSSSEKLLLSQDPRLGSYFAQKFISLLRFNASKPDQDAISILTLLNENLRMSNKPSNSEEENTNGITIFSTLRKDFKFFRDFSNNLPRIISAQK